jgi:hypothetical protein
MGLIDFLSLNLTEISAKRATNRQSQQIDPSYDQVNTLENCLFAL